MKEIDLYSGKLKTEIENMPFSMKIDGNNGDYILIPESDYGFAEIHRMYDDILVFLIPMYGGTPSFFNNYTMKTVDNLIEDLKKYIN